MEILFRSPARPQSLFNLNEILVQQPWESSSALLCAIRDITLATHLEEEHQSLLLSSLVALQIQESLFRPAVHTFDFDWFPDLREERIIHDACHGFYSVEGIEGAFYEYGGLFGLVALVAVFRDAILRQQLLRQWEVIKAEPAGPWLVSNVSQLFSSQRNKWSSRFRFVQGDVPPVPPSRLRYLGRRGREDVKSQAGSRSLHRSSPWEDIPCPYYPRKYRQPPSPTAITSSPDLDGQNRPLQEGCRHPNLQLGLSYPRPSSPGPAGGWPVPDQHDHLQEKHYNARQSSSTHRYMIHQKFHDSPLGQDLYQQHHFSHASSVFDPSPDRKDTPLPSPELPQSIAAFLDLDQGVKDLATLLVLLGEADIPRSMLVRATEPWRFFNSEGEPDSEPAPDLGHAFTDTQQLESALNYLESHALIRYSQDLQSFTVHSRLRLYVESSPSSYIDKMKYQAARLLFHTYPTASDLITGGELYLQLCRSQQPQFEHVLAFVSSAFLEQLSPQERRQVVLGCLSSSTLGRVDWKRRILRVAEEILEKNLDDSLLCAKLRLRRRRLTRLYPDLIEDTHTADAPDLHPLDESSNAHIGRVRLFDAQNMLYRGELPEAWEEVDRFSAKNETKPSTEERSVLQRITIFKARILRCSGDYRGSKELLKELCNCPGLTKSICRAMLSDLVSVHCELGEPDDAMALIRRQNFSSQAWLEIRGTAECINLSLAGSNFTTGLKMLMTSDGAFDDAQPYLRRARDIYQQLEKLHRGMRSSSLSEVHRHFSCVAGLAMIAHLEARFGSAMWRDAFSCWQSVSDVAERLYEMYRWAPGFLQSVIAYSKSDIAWRLGMPRTAANLIKTASEMYAQTGTTQFYWFSLAHWLDLVEQGLESNGMGRLKR